MDSIIPAAVVSTLSAVNSAIASVKNARDIAKQSQNADVKNAVLEVYDAVIDLKDKVLQLDEENRKLREKLSQRENVKRNPQFGYYFKEGESNEPLCPKCYEGTDKLIYLPHTRNVNGGLRRDCRECGFAYWEKPIPRPSANFGSKPDWMG